MGDFIFGFMAGGAFGVIVAIYIFIEVDLK